MALAKIKRKDFSRGGGTAGREGDPNPHALRTLNPNGTAPKSRLRSASQAYEVGTNMDRDDRKRRVKRSRLYKAYNRFPPTEYSKLAKEGEDWNSNVNFGMLAFVVDNNHASFYDMLTERPEAAQIKTKKGNDKEKAEWSDRISYEWDRALQSWDDYLLNNEQALLDMLLYGKGVLMYEDNDGWFSDHVSVDDLLVPDSTKINLSNFDTVVVKKSYTLNEMYDKIRDEGAAKDKGWNYEAVVEAMRWQRSDWKKQTREDFFKDIKQGNIAITAHLKETVRVYVVFIKEFNNKVSKHIVLRDYSPAFAVPKGQTGLTDNGKNDRINEQGFLFTSTGMFENYKRVFSVFIDNAGTGQWHNTPSLAEKIYVQCRQYDFAMNAIMDAIKINMSLILQGQGGDAAEKLKEVVFGPFTIIPTDIPFVQHRFALPTAEATNALQFMMLDMNRGIGQYRIHEKGQGGEAPTATQSQLDAAEAAKLTGTQVRRFNSQHTIDYRERFRKFVNCKEGETGYEIYKEFKRALTEQKVPPEAWAYENIESIKSNMLSGSGSPSYKLMAAEKTIAMTNIAPRDEGQENAIRDGIAALHGRANVDRYRPRAQQADPTWNERIIGFENEACASPIVNPQNILVFPGDNHVKHTEGHLNDMARTIALVNKSMKDGSITEDMAQAAATKLLNQGGHVNAHMNFLRRDESKKEMVKQFEKDLGQIQREADAIAQRFQQMKQAKDQQGANNQFDPTSDPDIHKKIALAQIELDTKQKLANIQIGSVAARHDQRQEIDREAAANKIAVNRAIELDKLDQNKKSRRKEQPPAA